MKSIFSAIRGAFIALLQYLLWPVEVYMHRFFIAHMDQYGIPDLQELQAYNVNRPGQIEAIKASLYDFQTYAQAGQTQLLFFQVPKGQSSKTLADTNMTLAGALPAPQSFLVQALEIYFFPAGDPSVFGTAAAQENINDVYDVSKSGWLELFIGSKPYLDEAPLLKFPPQCGLTGWAALASHTTPTNLGYGAISYASFGGPIYQLIPPILLVPTQNFNISLNWPTAVAISAAARIGVNLQGILYRNSQ